MNLCHKSGKFFCPLRLAQRTIRPLGCVLATLLCLLALSFGAVASSAATPWGPHDPGVVPSQANHSSTQRPHAVAPLYQANFVVTDLTTGDSSVYTYDNPSPNYTYCTSPQTQLCMESGPPSGGTFSITGTTLHPGQVYDNAAVTAAAGSETCQTAGDSNASGEVELDQYVLGSGSSTIQEVAVQFDCTNAFVDISGTIAYNVVPTDPGAGYYVFGQAGELTGFGNDNYLVYLDGAMYYNLNAPIVGMATTPDGAGYWMVGSDGGVFASGDAGFYGSTGGLHLNKPVVGMAATPDGKGYWFVASDGGIFAYGDAQFYGSTGSIHLNKPIVGMAATPDGKGYWLVAADGGIFAYGDAQFYGSTGSIHLNKPIVGMTSTPSGDGYWFVAADGGVFSYGDAGFYGSTGSIHLNEPIVGMVSAPDGNGYWFVASDGGVFNYGSAAFEGSLGDLGVTDVAGITN